MIHVLDVLVRKDKRRRKREEGIREIDIKVGERGKENVISRDVPFGPKDV